MIEAALRHDRVVVISALAAVVVLAWGYLLAGAGMGANASEVNTSWAPGFGVALLDRLVRDNYEGQ